MDSLRHRAREEFVRLYLENGRITRLWFAEYSLQILGEEVPLNTIQWWYKVDSWATRLSAATFDSVDLKRTKRLLDGVFKEIADFQAGSLSLSEKELSSVAQTLNLLVTGLPIALISLVEDELIDATDFFYDYVDEKFGVMLRTHRLSILRSYKTLRSRVLPEIPLSTKQGVEADSIVMGGTVK
jgi:hypothetical protein